MGYLLPRAKMIFSKPALIHRLSWCFSRRHYIWNFLAFFFLVWSLFYTFLVIVFLSSRLIFSMLRARFTLIFSMVFLSQKSRNVFKYSQPLYFLQTESNLSLVVVSISTDRHRSFNSIYINLKCLGEMAFWTFS